MFIPNSSFVKKNKRSDVGISFHQWISDSTVLTCLAIDAQRHLLAVA